MIAFWLNSEDVKKNVFIPKYYNPEIVEHLTSLKKKYDLVLVADLVAQGKLKIETGHEIGKMSYGTGDIPFVRTSDISNWEIKTAPKQGVSEEIYELYHKKQNIQEGDILIVRDGTYLIGTNCFITNLDTKIIYQSHILKVRVLDDSLSPEVLFIALNCSLVQDQIRARQFTADIIDTIGNRFEEVIIPIPNSQATIKTIEEEVKTLLLQRVVGKAFVKQSPVIIEEALRKGEIKPIKEFFDIPQEKLKEALVQDTIRAEFGDFECFTIKSSQIKNGIFLPKYYSPSIDQELKLLSKTCDLYSFKELRAKGILEYVTGDEIGKMAYGTGDIPFIRTSDFSNWEIKHNPKQGISEEIYEQYNGKQNVKEGDIFLVRDGTYLIGTSCIVTEEDSKCLFCGGLYKISVLQKDIIDEWLLLALLNSYIVKRQIRTKQFTRDVIDTIGKRIDEIILPVPKNSKVRNELSLAIKSTVRSRIEARNRIQEIKDSYPFQTS